MSREKKKWYRKEAYSTPREPFGLTDGSIVEVVKDPDERHPEALKLTRVWPDNVVTTVRYVPESQFSSRLYLSVEGDRAPQPDKPKVSLDEQLASADYHAPYAVTAAIPGKKPGETYDPATAKYFETRKKFNEYYKQNKLEQVSPHDSMFKFDGEQAAPSNVQGYDVNQGPPLPKGFEGARFATVGMGGD